MKLFLLLMVVLGVGYFGFKYNTRYTVIEAGSFEDGGTVHLSMRSSDGDETISVCIDRRIGTATHGAIYEGVRHPSEEGAIESSKERGKQLLKLINNADMNSLETITQQTVDDALTLAESFHNL